MKRVAAVLISLLLVCIALPWCVTAETVTGTIGNLTYEIRDGQATITGYNVAVPADLVIPAAVKGYPVTTIGYGAFEDAACSSVTIPDSVISIADYAFAWCTFLKTATVGNGVQTIGYGAFSYTGLTSISIGSGARNIDDHVFMSCGKMTAVTVAEDNPYYCSLDGVLYDKAVSHLVYYPGGKTGAFIFPETVTSYVNGAFDFCDGLTSVTLPAGLTRVSAGSFYKCTALGSVHVAEGNPYLCSYGGVVFSKDMSTLILCPAGRRSVYLVPEQVTAIADSAFEHCEFLTHLFLSANVKKIGKSAFAYCHKLTAITIPDSVTEIGDHILYDCDNLEKATIGNGITRLSIMTFYGCDKLGEIHLPQGLTYIGYGAFSGTAFEADRTNWTGQMLYYDTYLVGVKANYIGECIVREGTTVIGEYVFHDCTMLTSVVIPEGVRAIAFSTFGGCTNLKTVSLPLSVTEIGEYAFCNAPLTDVYYAGTERDRDTVAVQAYNEPLNLATWHCAAPPCVPGDANGDGKVNNRDLGLLQQLLNQ